METPSDKELKEACELALTEWQILPALAPRLLSYGKGCIAREPAAQRVLDRVISLDIFSRIQLRLLRRLVQRFQDEQIPHSMLKGTAVRFVAYSDPKLRVGKDFDIAVPPDHIRQAERIAQECGLLPAEWSEETKRFYVVNPFLRDQVERQHYELGFLVRRQVVGDLSDDEMAAIKRDLPTQIMWHLTGAEELACYVSVDLHHGLSLEVGVEELVQKSATKLWNGCSISIPPIEWILYHLVYKIYWEGVHNYRKGLYQYADLIRLIEHVTREEFERFVLLLDRHNLRVGGYFVLRRLESEFRATIAPEIKEFLEDVAQAPPGRVPAQENDFGDMWFKLWGQR
jgi:hypothetical protein